MDRTREKENCLIIPKLVRDCILGIDALKEYQFIINTPEEKLTLRRIDGDLHLNYSGRCCKVESMREVEVLTIEEESLDCKEDTETWRDDEEQAPKYDNWGRFESIPKNSEIDLSDPTNGSTDMHYDACRLIDGEIEEKFQGCTAISSFTLNALRNILQKYRAVFL